MRPMNALGLRAARWGAPVAFALFMLAGVSWPGGGPRDDAIRYAAAGAAVVATLLVRPGHRVSAPVAAVVAAAGVAVVCSGSSSNVGWFALVVLAGWLASIAPPAVWLTFWPAALGLLGVQALTSRPDPGWGAWIAGTTFSTFCCWLLRREHALSEQLREAQAGLAERAVAEERNRIAREVHDVVAHSLTVGLLHITSARLAVEEDPAQAAHALAEAERLSRSALTEVRQVVGLMRDRATGSSHAPLPDATRIPGLIEEFGAAGVRVALDLTVDLASLPNITGLAAYRILQEALTNSVRHSPGAPATARLAVTDGGLTITIDTHLASGASSGTGGGLGLVGMRQRAEALGGSCVAGPGGPGWRVQAEIPLPASASASGPRAARPAADVLATP
jgi:signal transduction histidine kinase